VRGECLPDGHAGLSVKPLMERVAARTPHRVDVHRRRVRVCSGCTFVVRVVRLCSPCPCQRLPGALRLVAVSATAQGAGGWESVATCREQWSEMGHPWLVMGRGG
jgi:hypothetical protein